MKLLLASLLLGSLLGGCDGAAEPAPAEQVSPTKQAMETTTATGYGKTHEDAYQEAVSQAVSQVCGVDVAKAIVGVPGGKNPTTDNKGVVGGISFDGVVKSCRVVSEERAKDGLFTVTVEAKICPPADIFAKRIALTLPSAEVWRAALSSGSLSPAMVQSLSGSCDGMMQNAVGQDRMFVLLDRSSAADEIERSVAAQGYARREEKAKTKGVKAADFVVDLSVSKAEESASSRHFATAGRTKFVRTADIAYTLKLIDVTTGGIVTSQSGEAHGNATAWYEEECAAKVLSQTEAQLKAAVEQSLQTLLQECKNISKPQ